MKIFSSIICFLMLPVASWAQTNFTIKGQLVNVPVKQVHISYWSGSGLKTKSADVVNNTYELQFSANPGFAAWLRCGDITALLQESTVQSIYLGPASFTITHRNQFTNMEFTGSPENTEYMELYRKNLAYGKKMEALRTRFTDAQLSANPAHAKMLEEELNKMMLDRKDLVYADYMLHHPDSRIHVFTFNQYAGNAGLERAKVVPLFNLLPDSIKSRPDAKAFMQRFDAQQIFDEVVAVGKLAPDFTQNDTAGKPASLSSFRGKYVLIDFWASWCVPCRAENPNVVKVYNKYHDKGFDIIGVSLDRADGKNNWLKAIQDDRLGWTQVSDLQFWNNAVAKLYGIGSIPQNFLIDPSGKIIARGLRGDDLDKKLNEVFSGK